MKEMELDLAMLLPETGDCLACANRLQETLGTQPGVHATTLDPDTDRLCVTYDPGAVAGDALSEIAVAEGRRLTEVLSHKRLSIGGMDCADCARTIEHALAKLNGVAHAIVNFAAGALLVEYDPEIVDLPAIQERIESLGYKVNDEETQRIAVFRVEGMDCADCAATLEKAISGLDQVTKADVNSGAALLTVSHTSNNDELTQQIRDRVSEVGYRALLEDEPVARQTPRAGWHRLLPRDAREWRLVFSGLSLLIGAVLQLAGAISIVTIPFFALSIVIGGWPIARSGWATLRTTRSLDINFLMTLAVIGAATIGEWTEGATVVFLFAVGNFLESRTMDRARQSIRQLMDLSPKTATRLGEDGEEKVLVEELKVGDRILVKPGERIPMDGNVETGQSTVDQSPITGESIPAEKEAGDEVFAGTINGEGALRIVVTRRVKDTTLSRIVRMVEEAQGRRAPSQRFVDSFARIYTPVVIGLAVAIAVVPPLLFNAPFADWLYRALVLLVISCPCALVVSTPVTIVSAISNAARHGILIKGGAHLESAGTLRAIAFDKTGTLTLGRPKVTDIVSLNGHQPDELLSIAAAIEENSEHALAAAIVKAAQRRELNIPHAEDFRSLAGRGAAGQIDGSSFLIGSPQMMSEYALLDDQAESVIRRLQSEGRTISLVADEEGCELTAGAHLIGAIGLSDEIRPDAAEAVSRLRAEGINHTIMLTGDHIRAAKAVTSRIGVDDVRAGLLPEQKIQAVEELLEQYGQVGMVGDGINDAPALARATIGIAMGAAGTDVALETADVALMSDDLRKVASLIKLSRRAKRIIAQNIAFALLLKLVFLGLAMTGLATLWMAVFADMGASLIVTLNGMRMLGTKSTNQ